MVRRAKGTLKDITNLDTLAWAYHRAALGKRSQYEVQAFEQDLLQNLAALGEAMRAGRAPRNEFRRFLIRDPKPRVIDAPIFEDRVAHHALIAVIGPALDAALIDDTFACRVGKGSLAAVHRAQHFVRRHDWYVKIDIRKYFASVPHERLSSALHKKLSAAGTRQLVENTIRGFEATSGHGLPIGALTSQHFANFYLGRLDRFILEQPEVRGLVRYMDDVIWWCGSRAAALQTLQQVRDFVPAELGLTLKGPGFVQRSRAGLSFLGFRIYPGALKLSRRRKGRYRAARRKWESLYLMGHITSLELQRGYEAALATTAHADALGFRRADLEQRPAPDA